MATRRARDGSLAYDAMTSLTRGKLPARVYWVRRLLVLGVALALVFGVAQLLGAGSDASSPPATAAQVSATQTTPAVPGGTATKQKSTKKKDKKKNKKPKEPVLAEPDGLCRGTDIEAVPAVNKAVAGRDVVVVLKLRTLESEACTWRASRFTLQVKISSGKDDIWSSRQCPRALPARDVVVRQAVSTSYRFTWKAKRSDAECSSLTQWALPGYYHVSAAALAGEPSEVQFELVAPTSEVITQAPSPTPKQNKKKNKNKKQNGGRPVTSSR